MVGGIYTYIYMLAKNNMLYACDELLEIRYIVSLLLHTYHIAQKYGSKNLLDPPVQMFWWKKLL